MRNIHFEYAFSDMRHKMHSSHSVKAWIKFYRIDEVTDGSRLTVCCIKFIISEPYTVLSSLFFDSVSNPTDE